ncbi:hypothetical protein [Sphingomonas sp.]|uniref:hypothetical protein n=1 Tax=Sphingomonas sp. TaxID=28214 RepID=UPI0035C82133
MSDAAASCRSLEIASPSIASQAWTIGPWSPRASARSSCWATTSAGSSPCARHSSDLVELGRQPRRPAAPLDRRHAPREIGLHRAHLARHRSDAVLLPDHHAPTLPVVASIMRATSLTRG